MLAIHAKSTCALVLKHNHRTCFIVQAVRTVLRAYCMRRSNVSWVRPKLRTRGLHFKKGGKRKISPALHFKFKVFFVHPSIQTKCYTFAEFTFHSVTRKGGSLRTVCLPFGCSICRGKCVPLVMIMQYAVYALFIYIDSFDLHLRCTYCCGLGIWPIRKVTLSAIVSSSITCRHYAQVVIPRKACWDMVKTTENEWFNFQC